MTTLDTANVLRRDAQGTRVNFAPVLDGRGGDRLGSFIPREIATRMTEANMTVEIQKKDGSMVSLSTPDDWAAFCDEYLRAPDSSGFTDKLHIMQDPRGLEAQFGMSYPNLCRALDDAASQVRGGDNPDGISDQTISMTIGGAWDQAAKIYSGGAASYGKDLDETRSVPLNASGSLTVELVPAPKIGPNIVNADMRFTRERIEREEQYEVVVTDRRTDNTFRDLSGNDVFQSLDVTRAGPYQANNGIDHIWQDQSAVDNFEKFPYPMHLEVDSDDDTGYQINRSPFIEGFVDTDDMKLFNSGQMIRFRWRPEQGGRTNIQGKQDQGRHAQTGLVNQRKFEHRSPSGSTGTGPNDEALHLDLMEAMAISGKIGNRDSSVHREIYNMLLEQGVIQPGESITLDTKIVAYQDRRRTHLIFYSLRSMESLRDQLQENLDNFDTLTDGADPADAAQWRGNLERMVAQANTYVDKIARRDELISKYGGRVSTSFDGLIISRDEKVGFEGGSFGNGSGIWPGDRRGRPAHWVRNADGDFEPRRVDGADRIDQLGTSILRAESELDSNVSDPVARALATCQATATGQDVDGQSPRTNIDQAEAQADLPELEEIYQEMGLCTRAAMELQAEAYEAAGLQVNRKPEDSTYQHFAKALETQGNRAWHNVVSIRSSNPVPTPINPPPPPPAPTPISTIDQAVTLGYREEQEIAKIEVPDDGQQHTFSIEIERIGASFPGRVNDVDVFVNVGSPPDIDGRSGKSPNSDIQLTDDPNVAGSSERGELTVEPGSTIYISAWGRGRRNTANIDAQLV